LIVNKKIYFETYLIIRISNMVKIIRPLLTKMSWYIIVKSTNWSAFEIFNKQIDDFLSLISSQNLLIFFRLAPQIFQWTFIQHIHFQQSQLYEISIHDLYPTKSPCCTTLLTNPITPSTTIRKRKGESESPSLKN
jgi:hypothetical protein